MPTAATPVSSSVRLPNAPALPAGATDPSPSPPLPPGCGQRAPETQENLRELVEGLVGLDDPRMLPSTDRLRCAVARHPDLALALMLPLLMSGDRYATLMAAKMIGALDRLGAEYAFVYYGEDGLDEITTTGPSFIYRLRGGEITHAEFTPEDFGVARARIEDLQGGTIEENVAITRAILGGEPGPKRDIAVVNAAPAIVAAGRAGGGVTPAGRGAVATAGPAESLSCIVGGSPGAAHRPVAAE